jgi:hypothetical protein
VPESREDCCYELAEMADRWARLVESLSPMSQDRHVRPGLRGDLSPKVRKAILAVDRAFGRLRGMVDRRLAASSSDRVG